MENYIVRIYRRDTNDPHIIAGMVENVVEGENTVFKNTDELMKILSVLPKNSDYRFRVE